MLWLPITLLLCRFRKFTGHRCVHCITTVLIYANQQAMALPARNARATPDGPEYWIQPCGVPSEGGDPPAFDSDLANFYADHLYNDLLYLNNWKNTYTNARFLMNFDPKVIEDAAFRYEWLQVSTTIPKQPGERLTATHYSSRQFAEMLTHASDIFQRIAVGWEQVAFDKTDTEFVTKFDATQTKIKNALCALDQVLAEKRMSQAPNPTRNVMPSELRSITAASQRDERNFRILKEYANALEYFADGFRYFGSIV